MKREVKKVYRAPRVTVHGALRDLTRQNSNNTDKDGGNNSSHSRT